LVQSRKTIRTDTKVVVDELEEALSKAHAKCMEDHGANVRAEKAKGGQGTAKKRPGKPKRRKGWEEEEEEEEEVQEEQEEEEVNVASAYP